MSDNQPDLSFSLSIPEFQLMFEAVQNLPFRQVRGLVVKLQTQFGEALQRQHANGQLHSEAAP